MRWLLSLLTGKRCDFETPCGNIILCCQRAKGHWGWHRVIGSRDVWR